MCLDIAAKKPLMTLETVIECFTRPYRPLVLPQVSSGLPQNSFQGTSVAFQQFAEHECKPKNDARKGHDHLIQINTSEMTITGAEFNNKTHYVRVHSL